MKRATYYNILGLDPGASKEEIRSSFRQLALKYHPDRNVTKKSAHTVFIAINNAYEVLINEKTRKEYDAYLANTVSSRVPIRRYSRKQDARIQETLSVFNSSMWDLEDLLKRIDTENMNHAVERITIYNYVLNLLGYLENAILGKSSRFSNFAGKRCKSTLHLENYFYSIRIEIEKYLKELETDESSEGLRRIVSVLAELIKAIGEIRTHI